MTITKRFWNLFRLKVSKTCSTCLKLYSKCQPVGFYISSARRPRVMNDTPKSWQNYWPNC